MQCISIYFKDLQLYNFQNFTIQNEEKWCKWYLISMKRRPVGTGAKTQNQKRIWFQKLIKSPSKTFKHFDNNNILQFLIDWYPTKYKELLCIGDLDLSQNEFNYVDDTEVIYLPDYIFHLDKIIQASNLIEVVKLYLCLVTRAMGTKSTVHILDVHRYAMLFLIQFHLLEIDLTLCKRHTGDKLKYQMLSTRLNLLILLNIPDDIKMYGHLQLLWELGGMGEGFIPWIKEVIHSLCKNFLYHGINIFMSKIEFIDTTENLVTVLEQIEREDEGPVLVNLIVQFAKKKYSYVN